MGELDPAIEELVKQAEELAEAGHTREALEHWRTVIGHITDPDMLCEYGDLAELLEEWAEAEDAYLSAIRLEPEWAGPYEALSILYMHRHAAGDLELAEKYLKMCLELEKSPHAYTLLGVTQERLGNRIKARESYNEALAIDPDYDEAYYNLGVTYREENPAKAISLFRKALELDTKYQAAYRELGWTLKLLKQYDEAEINLRKSIELDDKDGWAYIYLGNLHWAKQNLLSAEENFKTAIDIWPHSSIPYWSLAHLYECQERASEADFFYEKALQIEPDNATANYRYGVFLKDSGEIERAKFLLNRAANLNPEDDRAGLLLIELED
ncbi:MAG: tetratricopeptide repeat protein [Blastocatellia bacterium]